MSRAQLASAVNLAHVRRASLHSGSASHEWSQSNLREANFPLRLLLPKCVKSIAEAN